MFKLCIFAGTTEGRKLLELLAGRGMDIVVCVATQYGQSLLREADDVHIHAARMNAEEMRQFLREGAFNMVVDATHPYAQLVTENLQRACSETGMEYLRLLRNGAAEASDGLYVRDAADCAQCLSKMEGNILLTTGSKDLPLYCGHPGLRERIYARVLPLEESLRICSQCGIPQSRILAVQGPFDAEMNYAMLHSCNAKIMVTKDSGDVGGYSAKLHAAQRAGAQLVIIGRPPCAQEGLSLEQVLEHIETRVPLTPLEKKITLAGIGMGNVGTQTRELGAALEAADCVIGAQRMLDAVDCKNKLRYVSISTAEIAQFIRTCGTCRRFLVVFSGDTGFYSGARALCAAMEDFHLEVLPGIGSLQYFCARLGRGWEDVRCVSLHGRNCDLVYEVRNHAAVFAIVGGRDGAQKALLQLCAEQMGHLQASVGERMGYPGEKISKDSVENLAKNSYDALSVLLIENPNWGTEPCTHGLPDEAFIRSEVPMTKSEVRSVALSKLAPGRRSVVYDVGSGSGSVTVEAARLAREGRVYAVEYNPQALQLTRRNVEKFRLQNVELVEGRAPEALEALEAPSHVFIGGSGGNLREIIACALKKNPRVRMVATAVTLETMVELTEIGKKFETYDVVQINASRGQKLGRFRLMTAVNPVYIVTMQNPI